MNLPRWLRRAAPGTLASLVALPLLFAVAMTKDFSHDEHQHIAGGALFARHGLLPYRDFPYFHTPYLVFVYGWLFGGGNHLLLIARTFSAVCASLSVGVLCAGAWSILRTWPRSARLAGTTGAGLLMLSTPLFSRTAGHAWNQEPSTLFALLAVVLVMEAAPLWRLRSSVFLAGGCLGLAVGFRVTFAPMALPLLCIIYFGPMGIGRSRIALLGWFSLGAVLALGPTFWLFVIAPEQTFFDVFGFARANLAYRLAGNAPRNISAASKLGYALQELTVRGVAPLALVAALFHYWRAGRSGATRHSLLALGALAPFLLAGSLAPTPLYPQYFYPLIPFCVLGAVYALAPARGHSQAWGSAVLTMSCLLSLSVGVALPYYDALTRVLPVANWEPMQVEKEARALRALHIAGPVLTLAPTAPLEAGLDIYPAFSTGPFAWRVAPFIDPSTRVRLGVIAPSDLASYLGARPPGAVYSGNEAHLERALRGFAQKHDFEPHQMENESTAWLPQGVAKP